MPSLKLHGELQRTLETIRLKRNFNPTVWIDQKCKMVNDYMTNSGLTGCVVNLSGGIDSAVALGLTKRSSQLPGSSIKKILAISQPIHSSDWAFNRANECAKTMGVEMITIDQTFVFDALKALIDNQVGAKGNAFAAGQLKSYMRTPCAYYVAQLLTSQGYPSIVMGTGNKDEDGYLAYFCKAGDGMVDVQLIADLHKSEVFRVGEELGVPQSILTAPPSADLWDDQTNDNELGFSYDFIELWTNYLDLSEDKQKEIKRDLSNDALKQFEEWGQLAINIHKRNEHKFDSPKNIDIEFPMKSKLL